MLSGLNPEVDEGRPPRQDSHDEVNQAMVKYAFILSVSFAITAEPCVVLDSRSGDENGARIQIRRVQGDSAEPGTQLGDPIWRGDLFRLTNGRQGNWARAHF